MKKLVSVILITVILSLSLFSLSGCKKNTDACEYLETRSIEGREVVFVEICVKEMGKIVVLLDKTTAPITVDNFVSLVNDGFYNGLTFHRIITDFMIQGGDPNGDGSGGSPTKIYGEFSSNGWDNDISHKRGVISMARSNAPDSASSQFFICNADASESLDGSYAAFGYVVEGMSVVDKITEEVFPLTDLASYYDNKNIHPYYGCTYHDLWAYYGNGTVTNDADKPVIEYIKVLEDYELPEG